MRPYPRPQLDQLLRRAEFETRVSRRLGGFVRPRCDVHLLAGRADVEPGEVVDAVRGDGARGEAQGGAVEGGGVGEGAGGDEEVYVGYAGDHGWRGSDGRLARDGWGVIVRVDWIDYITALLDKCIREV